MDELSASLSHERVTADSSRLLGRYEVEDFSLFSTEEYLQRVFDGFRLNPTSMLVGESRIAYGTSLLVAQRNQLETTLREQGSTDVAAMASTLDWFFRIGFGMVEGTLVAHHVFGAKFDEADSDRYAVWRDLPQAERIAEMRLYLEAEDAHLLALNLLDAQTFGTMINYASNISLSTPRVTGRPPLEVSASDSPEARSNVIEGSLTALYLLREHLKAQRKRAVAP